MKYPHALPCIVLSMCVAVPAAWSGAARAVDVAHVGRPNIVLILADDKYEHPDRESQNAVYAGCRVFCIYSLDICVFRDRGRSTVTTLVSAICTKGGTSRSLWKPTTTFIKSFGTPSETRCARTWWRVRNFGPGQVWLLRAVRRPWQAGFRFGRCLGLWIGWNW